MSGNVVQKATFHIIILKVESTLQTNTDSFCKYHCWSSIWPPNECDV